MLQRDNGMKYKINKQMCNNDINGKNTYQFNQEFFTKVSTFKFGYFHKYRQFSFIYLLLALTYTT
jgi:hypothetical protein